MSEYYYQLPPSQPAHPYSSWPPPPPMPAPAPAPKKRNGLRLIAVGTLAVAIAAGTGVVVGHAVWASPSNSTINALPSAGSSSGSSGLGSGSFGSGSTSGGSSSSSGTPAQSTGNASINAQSVASQVDPGLVDINTDLSYQGAQAAGTGMVLTSNGEILTNNHVIDGATTISVTDLGNNKTYTASVVGYDVTGDVAVLQLKNASGLTTVNLGNSSSVSVGEAIVGIGNAGGTGGTPSTATGSVTALNQSITASDEGANSAQLSGLIESNADIQPGDSGGPLANSSDQVVGMDTAAASTNGSAGVATGAAQSYSIPINTALTLAKQIVASDASSTVHIGGTGFLGIEVSATGQSSSGSGGSAGGFGGLGGSSGGSGSGSTSATSGATIVGTVSGSPAAAAGLGQGDTITSLNGHSVSTPEALTQLLESEHPGDTVSVGWVDSSGQSHTTNVTLISGPPA